MNIHPDQGYEGGSKGSGSCWNGGAGSAGQVRVGDEDTFFISIIIFLYLCVWDEDTGEGEAVGDGDEQEGEQERGAGHLLSK